MGIFSMTNGPTKFDLMMSLFGTGMAERIEVQCTLIGLLERIDDWRFVIESVRRMEGASEIWDIEGWTFGFLDGQDGKLSVKARYDTGTRQGSAEVTCQPQGDKDRPVDA